MVGVTRQRNTSAQEMAVRPAGSQARNGRLSQFRLPSRPALALLAGSLFLVAGTVVTGLAGPAQAQVVQPMQSQDAYGQQQLRISELERLVQELTGKVEEAQYRNRQLAQKLDQLSGDMDFRLKQLEGGQGGASVAPAGATPVAPAASGAQAPALPAAPSGKIVQPAAGGQQQGVFAYMGPGGAPAPSATPSATPSAAPAASGSGGTPEQQYNAAFELLRSNNYPAAETSLKAFVQKYPTHELAGNAQYWLGETYYARGDYKQAAVTFLDGYRTYPKSAKGAENLLKLGMSMGNLNQNKEACAAFGKLGSEYPQAPDAVKRRAQQERSRLGC